MSGIGNPMYESNKSFRYELKQTIWLVVLVVLGLVLVVLGVVLVVVEVVASHYCY